MSDTPSSSQPLTPRISEIRERLAKATPGTWQVVKAALAHNYGFVLGNVVVYDGTKAGDVLDGYRVLLEFNHHYRHDHDAALIANAPSDLAWLLDRVEALEGERDRFAIRDKGWIDNAAKTHEALGNLIAGRDADAETIATLRAEIASLKQLKASVREVSDAELRAENAQLRANVEAIIEGKVFRVHRYAKPVLWFVAVPDANPFRSIDDEDGFNTLDEALAAYAASRLTTEAEP